GWPGDARGVGIARADGDGDIGSQLGPAQNSADPSAHFHPVLVDEAHHCNPDGAAYCVGVQMIGTEQPSPARAAAEANTESRSLVEPRAHRRTVRNTSPTDDIGEVDVRRLG